MTRNAKIVFGIIAILIIVWIGYATLITPGSSYGDKQIVKVGVITPLTGSRSDGGAYVRNALTLAEEEINEDDTRQYAVELIYEDSAYEPQKGVSAATKLINVDNVKFIIGPFSSSVTLAVAPIAESSSVVVITPASQSDSISSAGDFIFRTIHNTAQEVPFFGNFMIKHMKNDILHMLAINTEITPAYIENLEPLLQANGKQLGLIEMFDPKETNFRTNLLKIKSENPTDILLLAAPRSTGMIVKQAQELELDVQFYNLGVEGNELLEIGGEAAEGLLYPYSYDSKSTERSVVTFQEKYKDRYSVPNDTVAANAYDSLYLLSDCFERVGTESVDVKNCLYEITDYHGASGVFSIDKNGDAEKEFIIKTVQNGELVPFYFE